MSQGETCGYSWCGNAATEKCPGCKMRLCFDHKLMHGHIGHKSINLLILIKRNGSIKDRQRMINYYDKTCIQIFQKIKEFDNFAYMSHAHGTNVLHLYTNWKREKLRSLVNRILKIREVNGVFTFPNYVEELKEAKEMHDFFKVVAFSSTILESYGKQILIKYYEKKNQGRDHNKIYDLNFNATAIMLYSNGIIDKPLLDEIDYIRRERNKFIHRTSDPNLSTVLSKERVKTMEDLANKAIHSVSELMAKMNSSIYPLA